MSNVLHHEISLETLEAVTTAFFASTVRGYWFEKLGRGFGTPQIHLTHVEIFEADGTSDYSVDVMISFQGGAKLYRWRSEKHANGAGDYYDSFYLTPREIAWLESARVNHENSYRTGGRNDD